MATDAHKRDTVFPGSAAGLSVERGSGGRASPRIDYREFMVLDQAGPANIACDTSGKLNFVAVKRLANAKRSLKQRIRPFASDHVVNIIDSYFDNDGLVIIYEQMDISLRQVTGILQDPFKPLQIAAVCKQLAAGLSFIHEKLHLSHAELSCGTILLNLNGSVKIANIGDSFVQNRCATLQTRREDVRSIGFVMMELMEPTTFILNPRSAQLQSPENWKDGSKIKDFLRATQYDTLEELKKHDFFRKALPSTCLKAHVFCALRAAGTNWDILSLP